MNNSTITDFLSPLKKKTELLKWEESAGKNRIIKITGISGLIGCFIWFLLLFLLCWCKRVRGDDNNWQYTGTIYIKNLPKSSNDKSLLSATQGYH